jgi:hypothetical protein
VVDENVAKSPADAAEDELNQGPPQDHPADGQTGAQAVCPAEAELEKARLLCRRVRRQAAEHLKRVRETTAGDLLDGALKLVKQYPGPSILVTLALGFFLGRSFRR